MRGGFAADRVGWAFAAGYQAAVRQLIHANGGAVDDQELLAMCATEAGGNRPRDIRTGIADNEEGRATVTGEKSWTTLGSACTGLLVVGRMDGGGGENDRPTLKIAKVSADADGVALRRKPPLDFIPEVSHVAAVFDAVAVDAVLPGDGYSDFVKPFRTVEDTFIALAVQAWLLREGRARSWPSPFLESLTASLTGLAALADQPAKSPVTHVALAGALARSHDLYRQADELWRANRTPPPNVGGGIARCSRSLRSRERYVLSAPGSSWAPASGNAAPGRRGTDDRGQARQVSPHRVHWFYTVFLPLTLRSAPMEPLTTSRRVLS